MFSDAISSTSCRWRPSSPLIAAAISGSASASVAVKNESGAEAALELEDEEVMDEISPPPQALRGKAVGYVWRSKEVPARYHIGRNWPSTCGTGLVFMQDMVGWKGWSPGPPPPSRRPGLSRRHSGARSEPGISRFRVRCFASPRNDG